MQNLNIMRLTLSVIFLLFFLVDYVTYPIYFIIYHPWLVRKYKREDHARKEERDDCLIFHSLQAPTAVNITMERHGWKTTKKAVCKHQPDTNPILFITGLDTMDKVFDYVTTVSSPFRVWKLQNFSGTLFW